MRATVSRWSIVVAIAITRSFCLRGSAQQRRSPSRNAPGVAEVPAHARGTHSPRKTFYRTHQAEAERAMPQLVFICPYENKPIATDIMLDPQSAAKTA